MPDDRPTDHRFWPFKGSIDAVTIYDTALSAAEIGYLAAGQDTSAPAVTIGRSAGQPAATNGTSIEFTALFSEPVYDFTSSDVTLSGTMQQSSVMVVRGADYRTYSVVVSGMTGEGTVIARIEAGKAHDAAGNANTASTGSDNIVVYDPTPVTVQSIVVNGADGGGVQRSMVKSLVVTFSEIVTRNDSAFTVVNRTTSQSVVASVLSWDNTTGRSVVTLGFSGGQTQSGSLADGNYQLTIDADNIHDSDTGTSLDGDGHGSFGGNRVFGALAADKFFRLYGDSDGDRDVDASDYGWFRTTMNKTSASSGFLWYFDCDGDNDVDASDFGQFRTRMSKRLLFA